MTYCSFKKCHMVRLPTYTYLNGVLRSNCTAVIYSPLKCFQILSVFFLGIHFSVIGLAWYSEYWYFPWIITVSKTGHGLEAGSPHPYDDCIAQNPCSNEASELPSRVSSLCHSALQPSASTLLNRENSTSPE